MGNPITNRHEAIAAADDAAASYQQQLDLLQAEQTRAQEALTEKRQQRRDMRENLVAGLLPSCDRETVERAAQRSGSTMLVPLLEEQEKQKDLQRKMLDGIDDDPRFHMTTEDFNARSGPIKENLQQRKKIAEEFTKNGDFMELYSLREKSIPLRRLIWWLLSILGLSLPQRVLKSLNRATLEQAYEEYEDAISDLNKEKQKHQAVLEDIAASAQLKAEYKRLTNAIENFDASCLSMLHGRLSADIKALPDLRDLRGAVEEPVLRRIVVQLITVRSAIGALEQLLTKLGSEIADVGTRKSAMLNTKAKLSLSRVDTLPKDMAPYLVTAPKARARRTRARVRQYGYIRTNVTIYNDYDRMDSLLDTYVDFLILDALLHGGRHECDDDFACAVFPELSEYREDHPTEELASYFGTEDATDAADELNEDFSAEDDDAFGDAEFGFEDDDLGFSDGDDPFGFDDMDEDLGSMELDDSFFPEEPEPEPYEEVNDTRDYGFSEDVSEDDTRRYGWSDPSPTYESDDGGYDSGGYDSDDW